VFAFLLRTRRSLFPIYLAKNDVQTGFIFFVSPDEFLDSEVKIIVPRTAIRYRQKKFSYWTSKGWANYNKYSWSRKLL
jgi:hypothetical protein